MPSMSQFILMLYLLLFQETAKSPKTAPMSPDDMDDVESPALQVQPPGRRRGAISAEPIREEDIESYVKKVLKWISSATASSSRLIYHCIFVKHY